MYKLNRAPRLLFSVLLLATLGCGSSQETNEDTSSESAVTVSTSIANRQVLPQKISYSGNLEASEVAFVSGQNGTRIDRIHADEGAYVQKGQILALMNPTQFLQAQLQVDLANRELQRLDTLVKIGSVSAQQFDQMQTELENTRRNLENVLENTELRAPFSGVVTSRYFSRGEVFTPGADRPAILTLMQISPIKLSIQVAEEDYPKLHEGMDAQVDISIYPEKTFQGKIFRKVPQIDTGSRTFELEIMIDNLDQELKPGMFGRVNINIGDAEGVFVPSTAVLSQSGTNEQYIFTIDDQDMARKKNVTTGARHQDLVEITEGLMSGETFVTEGMQKLVDKSTVRVIDSKN